MASRPLERRLRCTLQISCAQGHCRPSRHHVDGNFKLGPWVATQRYNKGNLSVERKRRLNAIGFVWNWRDYLWDRGFAALLKFKRREGHCHVPALHSEGNFKLGYWVSTQRRNKKEMSAERKARLNKIGFVWNENTGGAAQCRRSRRNSSLVVEKR